jgi:hypothetical protein
MGLGYLRQSRPRGRLTLRQRAVCALLAALALILFPAQAFAQSDTDTAPSVAVILDTGTMAKSQDMDFGDIAQPSAAGTVVLTPTPTATCGITGGVVMRTGPCTAAEFAILGRKNWLVRIREQNGGTIVLTGPGGATMTVTNMTIDVTDMVNAPGGGNPPGTFGRYRIVSDAGFATFRIGGRLNVNANQAFGDYTGTLSIQVLFN